LPRSVLDTQSPLWIKCRQKKAADERPNILFILVDDMGYTDVGYMGGEIDTPILDQLAASGVNLTNLHTAPLCSTSRAMLMSGMNNHLSGLGMWPEDMAPNQKGQPGYEGYLNFRVAALPEVMRDANYHTDMSGKWHLGFDDHVDPAVRGFEKSFVIRSGGGGHFTDMGITAKEVAIYSENGKRTTIPEDFYSTEFYADRMIEYINSPREDGEPFFAYLAFTAPHWPLQAPDAAVAKYRGK
jgi:arylsulfatase